MGEECLDWAKLPNDCVDLISRRLIDPFDLMSFRGVCKSWFNAIPREKQLKFPLLLVAKYREKEWGSAECLFYSIMSKKIYTVHRPEALNKSHLWQAGGYLGMIEKAGDGGYIPSLLNPLTGAQLSLHHVTGTCSKFFPLNVGENPVENYEDVVISFCSLEGSARLSYWNKTSSDWVVTQDFPGPEARSFYKGRVFTCSRQSRCTKVTQLEGEHKVIDIAFPDDVTNFYGLVQVKEDLIGIVVRNVSGQLEKMFFEVYKLDEEITPPRWIKINSIGENMIFLNYKSHAFSISSSHFDDERIKGNSIYFTKSNMRFFPERKTNEIGICQLGDKFSKILDTGPPDVVTLTWIIPNFS